MYVLNEQQVSFILDDIRRNGIEMEELQLNLLDHICCIVENEMPPDTNFDEFYRNIIPRFFKRELREIQEETNLLLTFKHYYAMKNVMIKSGAISAIGIIAGAIFKIMHWPGASAIIVLTITIISFVFLPLLFLLKFKEAKEVHHKTTFALAAIIGILFCLSTMFKIQHWPGANVMWLFCIGILFLLFLPIYFFSGIRNPETKANTMVSTVLIMIVGGMLFTLTSLRPSQWLQFVTEASATHVYSTSEFAKTQNKLNYALLLSDSSKLKSDVLPVYNACNELCEKIENIKTTMVDAIKQNQDPQTTNEDILRDFTGNYDVPTHFLFSEGETPKAQLVNLKSDINKLRSLLKEKCNVDASILSTDDVNKFNEANEGKVKWEVVNFYHVPYEVVVRNLTQIQLDVRLVQASCVK